MKKSRVLSSSIIAAAVSLSLVPALKAATITDWSFDAGGTIAAPYNAPTPSLGSGTAIQLGMTNSYTYTNGEGPGSAANCDVLASAGASTGAGAFAWRVRGNGNSANTGAGVANGWNSSAPIATQGAEFSVSTVGFNNITLSVDVNATGQAERNLAILYTLDDTVGSPTWVNATITSAGSLATLTSNSSSPNTITGNYLQLSGSGTGWNNSITASFPAGAAQDSKFAVEIVNASTGADDLNTGGTALNNSSGNWRYDNVIIGGTAVPEPTTCAAVLGGMGVLLGFGKVRRANRKA
jgi:hypothetical protein